MKLTVDTNVLLRAAVCDEPKQAEIAIQLLKEAELIAIPTIVLCEFVWVLRSFYKFSSGQIASTLRALIRSENVEINQASVNAGLDVLDAGGDFADGAIAHEGKRLGGETFASFDKTAIDLLKAQGHVTQLL